MLGSKTTVLYLAVAFQDVRHTPLDDAKQKWKEMAMAARVTQAPKPNRRPPVDPTLLMMGIGKRR